MISSDSFYELPTSAVASSDWRGGAPGLSEEEMAAFLAEYQPNLSVSAYGGKAQQGERRWREKPKISAAPMERMKMDNPQNSVLCPHCKEGSLRLVRGKNGVFWGCTNYPSCTATYDDENGKPALP